MVGAVKKSKKSNVYKEIMDSFAELTNRPELFLKPQPEKFDAIHDLIQLTYKASISGDLENKDELLPELILEGMDEEQIWQQLEIRNDAIMQKLVKETAELTTLKEQHLSIELEEENDSDEEEDETDKINLEQAASDNSDLDTDNENVPKTKAKNVRRSVVDDEFFKLNEMKEFLEQEDAKEMRKQKNKGKLDDTDAIDYFANDFGAGEDSDDDDPNVNYADFFDMNDEFQQPSLAIKKSNQKDFFNENESNNDEEELLSENETSEKEASEIDETEFVAKSGIEVASNSETSDDEENELGVADAAAAVSKDLPQSSNELREARLLQRIRDYEEIVLGEKPWQLKGEVQAASRPQNSLLEEILEFDSTTRPAVPNTEEVNQTIEDIIKQRIRDCAWDDVVRKVRPQHTPQEFRKQLVLDQEKSKQSLAQIYEQQYQHELDKINPSRDTEDNAGPEPKEYQEIRNAMRTLFVKLDALSNFHFTPKPVAPEVKIVTNTPAVHMEEVAPIAVSDAKLLAPEEVFRGPKHAPQGKTERTRTDKNRERRKKKQKQRAINDTLEKRDQQRAKEGKAPTQRESNEKLLKSITKSRNVQKITSSNDQSALKSSKAFFNKLQDATKSTATSNGKKRTNKDVTRANAKKLKL